jgi:hypothetical protein
MLIQVVRPLEHHCPGPQQPQGLKTGPKNPASLVIQLKSVLQFHPLIEILAYGKNPKPLLGLFILQYFQVTYWVEKKLHCDLK